MEVLSARVVLRERSLLDTLDLAIRFIVRERRAFGWLALLVLPGPALVCWLVGSRLGWGWGWLTALTLTRLSATPFTLLASRLLFDRQVTVREVLRAAVGALGATVLARGVQLVGLVAGLLALLAPAAWVTAMLLFVPEIAMLERAPLMGALGRSARLVSARLGDGFLTVLLLAALELALPFVGDAAGRSVLGELLEITPPTALTEEGGSVLALLAVFAFVPFAAVARFLVYINMRTRTEGWDIQTRFAALARGARVGVGPASRAAAVLLVVLAALTTSPARALDPAQAEKDRSEALAANDGFCKHPRQPLSAASRRLCKGAEAIAGCEGFVKACAEAARADEEKTELRSPWSLGTLSGALAAVARVGLWVLLAGAVLLVLVPVLRHFARRRRDAELADPLPPAEAREIVADVPIREEAAEILLRRAEELERAGRTREASAAYLSAALRALADRGALRLGRHRTNGEYVQECGEADARPALRSIAREADRAEFGGQPPAGEALARVGDEARRIVRKVVATTTPLLLVLLLTSVSACGGDQRGHGASDPAGNEILATLLQKQGLEVKPLPGSLTGLHVPEPNDPPTPAVLVDVSRTDLDSDAAAHLVRWVRAGGYLVLVGATHRWPKELGARAASSTSATIAVEDDEGLELIGQLVEPAAIDWPSEQGVVLASTRDAKAYAVTHELGRGEVLAMASDDLVTNAGLARPGNGAAVAAILSSMPRRVVHIAAPEGGITPPSNPVTSLVRAGLGLGLLHALLASLVLFLAAGWRLTRPRPSPPPRRRAFAEHVEATGALYARTRVARHALVAYARYVQERMRQRTLVSRRAGPAPAADLVAVLAAQSGVDPDRVARVWQRAVAARDEAPDVPARGDELATLKELAAIYAAVGR